MKKALLISLLAFVSAGLLRADPNREQLLDRVQACEAILQEFASRPAIGPSKQAWQSAKAILITNQFKAGFIIGVQDGYGVIMVKKADGRWSLPVLVSAGEASFGLQVGAKSVESVFLIEADDEPVGLVGLDWRDREGPELG